MPPYRKKREYHGGKGTRLYNVHRNMMERCFNPECKDYLNYGARGITVDPCLRKFADYRDWFQSTFGEDDLPQPLTVDRIDNDGSYTPNNLRLATQREQQNNRGNNVRVKKVRQSGIRSPSQPVTFNAETRTIAEWSRETGIPRKTLEKRLRKYKWSAERALTTPTKSHWQWLEHNGQKKTINQWSDETGISGSTIRHRLSKGWPVNKVLGD